jgi:hypothetical protein
MIFLFTGLRLKYQRRQDLCASIPVTQATVKLDGGLICQKWRGSLEHAHSEEV